MYSTKSNFTPYNYCLSNTANILIIGSQVPSNPNITVDNTFLWLIVPQVFNGLAQLLVNMTVLEFLCAQAPRSLQGLLIGLWYAMFSIRYLLMRSLDYVITSPEGILIYQVVRTVLVLLSLVTYMCVSRGYRYRVRDWVVNVQWMVEDIIERRIDQEESYIRRQMTNEEMLFQSSSSDSDSNELGQLLN